jgi:UDP-MurNAc hydroxylase
MPKGVVWHPLNVGVSPRQDNGLRMQVSLINHACVKLSLGGVTILCDPWLSGPAFNQGWDLLIKTPLTLDEVMAGVTHIWVSHEHPDHFVPKFFSDIAPRYGALPVLFQETRDKRIKSFLESRGFTVTELPDRRSHTIGGVRLMCGVSEFYDSWLHLTDGTESILNLNDCAEGDDGELRAIARLTGPVDVLLTQFSYAAWKGGRDNAQFRKLAAANKLKVIAAQIHALKPRLALPFASFVYFSNEENFYLNDHVNRPSDAAATITAAGAQPLILFPGETWNGGAHDNVAALASYRQVYDTMVTLPLRPPGESVPLERLEREFSAYRDRVYANNSRALIALLRRLPLLGAFRPVTIRLTDLATTVSVSVVDGFDPQAAGPPDVTMHSSSLSFIFNNAFGFDTLTVNGRFEATPEGFGKMTKSLAIGSLNAMGLAVSPKLVMNFKVVLMLLRRLASVLRTMAQGAQKQPSGA